MIKINDLEIHIEIIEEIDMEGLHMMYEHEASIVKDGVITDTRTFVSTYSNFSNFNTELQQQLGSVCHHCGSFHKDNTRFDLCYKCEETIIIKA